jgi:hypothetical protein
MEVSWRRAWRDTRRVAVRIAGLGYAVVDPPLQQFTRPALMSKVGRA